MTRIAFQKEVNLNYRKWRNANTYQIKILFSDNLDLGYNPFIATS